MKNSVKATKGEAKVTLESLWSRANVKITQEITLVWKRSSKERCRWNFSSDKVSILSHNSRAFKMFLLNDFLTKVVHGCLEMVQKERNHSKNYQSRAKTDWDRGWSISLIGNFSSRQNFPSLPRFPLAFLSFAFRFPFWSSPDSPFFLFLLFRTPFQFYFFFFLLPFFLPPFFFLLFSK